MATKRGFYRDSRTGAIRQSSAKLGYPYVPADQDAIDKLPGQQPSASQPSTPDATTESPTKKTS